MHTYRPGELIKTDAGHFKIEALLSQSDIAHSYRAQDLKQKKPVLFKIYANPVPDAKYSPWYPAYFKTQEDIRKRLHPVPGQAIGLHSHFVHRRAYHQVVGWANGKPLEALLPALNDQKTLEKPLAMAKVMLYTLHKVHEQGIIHCDLKPANYFAEEDAKLSMRYRLKMVDFDQSLVVGRKSPKGGALAGTFGYLSPEHLRDELPSTASDVFTVGGIMLYELLAGVHPLESVIASATTGTEANAAISDALQAGRLPALDKVKSARLADLPFGVAEIVSRCLSWNPDDRPTAHEVHRALLGEGLGKRLVLIGGPAQLRWRLSAESQLNRRLCERLFAAPAGAVSRCQGRFVPSPDFTQWVYHPEPGSTNGALIDGIPVYGPTPLDRGQTLQIGNLKSRRIGFEMKIDFEPIPSAAS